jgi:catechol 2,3-dioxygenase-like lactoylglutathione lyase family enzyme
VKKAGASSQVEKDNIMTQIFIEHVNITVSDPHRTAKVFMQIFDWHIRWQGPAINNGWTIHVGDDQSYLALYRPQKDQDEALSHKKALPLNHIGLVVDDLDQIERRVIAQGFTPFSHGDYDPGRRFYFFDHDGIEYEIISYTG